MPFNARLCSERESNPHVLVELRYLKPARLSISAIRARVRRPGIEPGRKAHKTSQADQAVTAENATRAVASSCRTRPGSRTLIFLLVGQVPYRLARLASSCWLPGSRSGARARPVTGRPSRSQQRDSNPHRALMKRASPPRGLLRRPPGASRTRTSGSGDRRSLP